jgi:hypothetical protein
MSWSASDLSGEIVKFPHELRRSLSDPDRPINFYINHNHIDVTVQQAYQNNYDSANGTVGYLNLMGMHRCTMRKPCFKLRR